MPTKHSFTHAGYRAIAALARWLPTAPLAAPALAEGIVELLAAESSLPLSLAIRQGDAWLCYGVTPPDAQSWISQCRSAVPGSPRRKRESSTGTIPARNAMLTPTDDLQIAVAVWDAALSNAAFEALAAQISFAFSLQAAWRAAPTGEPTTEQAGTIAAIERIVRELNTTLNLDHILEAVLREARRVTGATHGAIALKHSGDRFRYIVASGYTNQAAEQICAYALGTGHTPADEALRLGQAVVVPAAATQLGPGVEDRAISALDVPIRYQDHVVGLITLRSATTHTFDLQQLGFMRLIADHTAVAIGNAQHVAEQMRQRELLQQRATVLSEVLEVGHLLRADRPLPDMLTDIAYGIVNAVGFRSVIINLRGETDPTIFEPVAFAGVLPDEVVRLRRETIPATIVEQLCNTRWQISSSYLIVEKDAASVFGDDLERLTTTPVLDQRAAHEWQASDMFVTPLYNSAGAMIGFISVDDPFDRRRPTQRAAEAIEIFANQAAIAAENVRLYNQSQRRLAEQNALNRIHRAISASLDIRHILREVYAELQPVLAMDSFYSVVYYHDSTVNALEISVDRGAWAEADLRMDQQNGLHGYMLQQRQPLLFGDLYAELDRLPPLVRPIGFGDQGQRSAAWMGTPLIAADNEVIGALSVHSYTAHRFGADEFTFLQAVAHQVAISLQNARLFADRERRLHDVNVVNQLAQTLAAPIGLQELAEVLYSQISDSLQSNSVFLAVYDRQNDLVEFPLVVERYRRHKVEPQRGARGVTEYMLRTRQPLLLNDDIPTQLAALSIQTIGDMPQSFVGMPLLVGEEAVGVIAIQDYDRNHAFGQHELELLQAIAHQIASGIEKARLLQERERQIAQMQALNNIGKATSSTLDLSELFIDMYIELQRYRQTDTLLLSVCDPEAYQLLTILTVDLGELHHVATTRPIRPNSYTDLILRTRAPLLLQNAPEQEKQLGLEPVFINAGRHALSFAGVPLLTTSGQPFGVLSMQSYTASEYDLRDIDFLTNVANQISLNIQNAALFKQSQEQVQQLAAETARLELINRVSSWAGGVLDINELLQRAVDEMGRMTNADQVRLLLLDRVRGLAVCHAELHDTGGVGTIALPIDGNPAIEWFNTHDSAMLVRDAVNDPRFAPVHDIWRAANIQDVLIVPLIVKGEVLGTIGLDAQARDNMFNERDIASCEAIANTVATAVENARLWKTTQQSVQELTMLYDLSVSLTTMLDLDEILATLASAALEIERADVGAIVLLDDSGNVNHFAGLTRSGDELTPEPFHNNTVLKRILAERKPLVMSQAAAVDREQIAIGLDMRSAVLVPIVVKNQSVGVLLIAAAQPRSWSEREQSLLTILASQAASAIENAHLFKSEQEKRQLADTLREVALSLTSTLDLQEVLKIILVQLRRVVPYDSTSVQLLREDNQLEIISGRDLGESTSFTGICFPADSLAHPNHWVIETQQPHIVNNVKATYPVFAQLSLTERVESWLGVPLIYGNQLLGMITLDSWLPDFYTPAMADLALMFATQAAQAIAHARLFDQIRGFNVELEQMVADRTAALTAEKERLEAVHTITTTLTASLDIDEIVLKTLELAAGAVGVRRGSVLIRDPMRDQLIYRAVLSESEGLITTMEPFDLPPGNLVQWTLDHQQGVVVEDVRQDARWIAAGKQTSEIRSFLAVPLLAADVPLGVLMLNSRKRGYFNDEHLRLLSTIASEVAIAVHNAELYNFINEQATRLAELLQLQREETGKNRAILESVAEGVLVLDEQNMVVVYNRAASQVLRISDAAMLGRSLDRIAEYGDTDEEQQRALLLYDALADGVRRARQHRDELHTRLELPGQTIDLTFTPVTTPDGERVGVAAVLRDITREIEADKAKRAFISTVSHELRTPLTSVKGYVDLLMLGTAGSISDMQKSFLQVVKSNADRLNGLVEDLLEISRLENGKVRLNIKPLALPEIVHDIVASLRTETQRKRMELVLEIEPTLPVVEADAKRVSQVLTNLLSNAHKYTRDGGLITVRAFRRDAFVQIDVVDTGVGIPLHQLSKMFAPFFRTDNALKDEVGGTGLGLSIAKSFVELHGGDMWVTSEVEVGSTFSFTLPILYSEPIPDDEQIVMSTEVMHAG